MSNYIRSWVVKIGPESCVCTRTVQDGWVGAGPRYKHGTAGEFSFLDHPLGKTLDDGTLEFRGRLLTIITIGWALGPRIAH